MCPDSQNIHGHQFDSSICTNWFSALKNSVFFVYFAQQLPLEQFVSDMIFALNLEHGRIDGSFNDLLGNDHDSIVIGKNHISRMDQDMSHFHWTIVINYNATAFRINWFKAGTKHW